MNGFASDTSSPGPTSRALESAEKVKVAVFPFTVTLDGCELTPRNLTRSSEGKSSEKDCNISKMQLVLSEYMKRKK